MDGGYGPNVATDAHSLELQNVQGEITGLENGDLLRVPLSTHTNTGSCSRTAIQIAVMDILNRRITVSNDAGEWFLPT